MPKAAATRDTEALRKRVEERAYALWESEGRPLGRDLDHWRQAESEITAPNNAETAPKSNPTASSTTDKRRRAGADGPLGPKRQAERTR
jgi:hypothetical protein